MRSSRLGPLLVSVPAVVSLACSSDGGAAGSDPAPGVTESASIEVIAAFYPLQYVVERIGGATVSVENLTPPGVEPHDLELTAQTTAALQDADLVVYLSGFAPAVDEGVGSVAADHALDVRDVASLELRYTPIDEGEAAVDEAGSQDPHFWLDPVRLAGVVEVVVDELTAIDESEGTAALLRTNADALLEELAQLDEDIAAGLAECESTVIVTSHTAFGYLADRYGMTQLGITGLTPEDEPSPGDLAAVAEFVEENDVGTIYYETLVSPAIADTVAAETGATTAVLDPLEGLSDDSQGSDYMEIMRDNLATLRSGQGCT